MMRYTLFVVAGLVWVMVASMAFDVLSKIHGQDAAILIVASVHGVLAAGLLADLGASIVQSTRRSSGDQMVIVQIERGEGPAYLDRGSGHVDNGEQIVGFELGIGGAMLKFDDENDAAHVATKILERLGRMPAKEVTHAVQSVNRFVGS